MIRVHKNVERNGVLAFFSGGAFLQALNDLLLLFSKEFSHAGLGLEETIGAIGMSEEKIG